MLNKTILSAIIAAAIAVTNASADERKFISSAPTTDEYVSYLFQQEAPAQIKTRGIPTRGIKMTGSAAATAPSAQPVATPKATPKPTVLAAPVNFALDSAAVPAEFEEYLVNLAEAMKRPEAEGKLLIVSGHTDSQGSDNYNLELSVRRADAIESFLLSRGVAKAQLISLGKGESELVEGHETDHALNRRVEFKVAG